MQYVVNKTYSGGISLSSLDSLFPLYHMAIIDAYANQIFPLSFREWMAEDPSGRGLTLTANIDNNLLHHLALFNEDFSDIVIADKSGFSSRISLIISSFVIGNVLVEVDYHGNICKYICKCRSFDTKEEMLADRLADPEYYSGGWEKGM